MSDQTRPFIRLLFNYQDQTCQVIEQWRWDFNTDEVGLDHDKSTVICYRKDQDNTHIQNVKFEVFVEETVIRESVAHC